MTMQTVFEQLTATIESRKAASPDSSYVAKLFHKGADSILKKVGEEATEVVIAAKDEKVSAIAAHRIRSSPMSAPRAKTSRPNRSRLSRRLWSARRPNPSRPQPLRPLRRP